MPVNSDSTTTAKNSLKKFDRETQRENSTESNKKERNIGTVGHWKNGTELHNSFYIIYCFDENFWKLNLNTIQN